jgi:hypothetical protein
MNLRTRLDKMETVYRPSTSSHIPGVDESYLAWLSEPSLWTVLSEFAEKLAHRRYRHEDGCAWYANETNREARADDELRAVAALMAILPLHQAIQAWLREPDTAGWPALEYATDYAAFTRRLATERDMIARHRTSAHSLAQVWRHRHPTWQADLSPSENDAWEVAILQDRRTA